MRRVEVANVRPQLQQQIGRRAGVIIRFAAVRIFAEVVQHGGENLFRRVEEGDAAAFQFFEVLRLQHQIPAVHRRIFAENGFHLIHVVANARRRPQVRHGVFILRVMLGDQLQHFGVKVLPVGQLTFIQRLEHARRQLAFEEACRRHHQVETGATRH